MGKTQDAPDAPSLARQQETTGNIAALNLQWAKDQMAYATQVGEQLSSAAGGIYAAQMPAVQDLFQWADSDRQRYQDVFRPAQDAFIADAKKYTSNEGMAEARQQAQADTAKAFQAQRDSARRKLESYGIDSKVTKYGALDRADKLAQAKAQVLNSNQAAERNRQIGDVRMQQATALGANLPGGAVSNTAAGTNLGTGALGTATGAYGTTLDARNAGLSYSQAALQGQQTSADITSTGYANQLDQFNSSSPEGGLAGIGAAAGAVIGGYFGGPSGAQAGMQAGGQIGGIVDPGEIGGTQNYNYDNPPGAAEGGSVKAPGGPTADAGVLRVSDGEYVLPAELVRSIGAQMLDQFVAKRTGRKPGKKAAIPVKAGM